MKEISPQAMEKIEVLVKRYPVKRSALLEVLHIVQEEWGYIDQEGEERVAEILDLEPVQVHEVVSFYTMYERKPVGNHIIRVCRNLTCTLMGADNLINYLKRKLKVKVGGTTSDGRFTLQTVECLGACEIAPVMQIDGEFYGNLTPDKIDSILEEIK